MTREEWRYVADKLNAQSDIKRLLESYGVRFRGDRCVCFIHPDAKKLSGMAGKNNSFYCNSCGALLNAIHVVQHFAGVKFTDACRTLDNMLGLGLTKELTPEEKKKLKQQLAEAERKRREAQKKAELAEILWRKLSDYCWQLRCDTESYTPSESKEPKYNQYEYIKWLCEEYYYRIEELVNDYPNIEKQLECK